MRLGNRMALLGAVLMAGAVIAPVAEADGWRDRGHRDGPRWSQGERHGRGWDRGRGPPGRVHHHHHYRQREQGWDAGSVALGAIIGLGAGVALGTVLAPPVGQGGVPR